LLRNSPGGVNRPGTVDSDYGRTGISRPKLT